MPRVQAENVSDKDSRELTIGAVIGRYLCVELRASGSSIAALYSLSESSSCALFVVLVLFVVNLSCRRKRWV